MERNEIAVIKKASEWTFFSKRLTFFNKSKNIHQQMRSMSSFASSKFFHDALLCCCCCCSYAWNDNFRKSCRDLRKTFFSASFSAFAAAAFSRSTSNLSACSWASISSDEPVLDDIYTSSSKQQSRRRNRHVSVIIA